MVAKGYDPFTYGPVTAQQGGYAGTYAGGGGFGPRAGGAPPSGNCRRCRIRASWISAPRSPRRSPTTTCPGRWRCTVRSRTIDPAQVLSRQAQLDVANQLNAQQMYGEAADAYEAFLRTYPKFEQIEQVELMLGLIYARYLQQYDRAKGYLVKAMSRLHGDRELAMARAELLRIEPFTIQVGPAL